jgi:hypothetical protein
MRCTLHVADSSSDVRIQGLKARDLDTAGISACYVLLSDTSVLGPAMVSVRDAK